MKMICSRCPFVRWDFSTEAFTCIGGEVPFVLRYQTVYGNWYDCDSDDLYVEQEGCPLKGKTISW